MVGMVCIHVHRTAKSQGSTANDMAKGATKKECGV